MTIMIMMILMTKMIITVFSENRLWRQNCLACTSIVTNICIVKFDRRLLTVLLGLDKNTI